MIWEIKDGKGVKDFGTRDNDGHKDLQLFRAGLGICNVALLMELDFDKPCANLEFCASVLQKRAKNPWTPFKYTNTHL